MEENLQQAVEAPAHDAPDGGPQDAPAGFWVRGGAAFVDGLVLLAILFAAAFGLTLAGADAERASSLLRIVSVAVGCAYYTGLTGFSGQTLGKMAAGIRVVTKDGGPVGFGRALARWASYSLSALPLGAGFAAAGLHRAKRALHDYVAGTRVVYLPGTGTGRKRAFAGLGVLGAVAFGAIGILTAAAGPGQQGLVEDLRREGQAVGNLQALRTLVMLYREEKGAFPARLEQLSELQDFTEVPALELPGSEPKSGSAVYEGAVKDGEVDPAAIAGSGGWGYDPKSGAVFIDSTATDSAGTEWYRY